MSVFKRAVMFVLVVLACSGIYSAVRNMPVIAAADAASESIAP